MQCSKEYCFQAMLIALSSLAMSAASVVCAEEAPGSSALSPASSDVFAKPVSAELLDSNRGGADTLVVNEHKLSATLSHNSASDLSTGTNAISDGAFVGSSGFPMVIQNTGNNVIIQNSTTLNLNLK